MPIIRIGGSAIAPCSADIVGAKAANLARMARLGFSIPPAFVLPIALCDGVVAGRADAEQSLRDGLREGIAFLEQATGKTFGDHRRPLLVSVRSGAARSMPGMLDTVLDVGCTSAAVQGLIRSYGRPRLAWDCRRRFIESFSETVLGASPAPLAARREELVTKEGVTSDRELDSEAIERLADEERALVEVGSDGWLEDAGAQLEAAARAVYHSWSSERAQTYRKLQNLDHLRGTAVTIQAMVFGNGGLASGAGVAFSRDPSTGAAQPIIDLVLDAQGEDVVSGRRTPDSAETIARALPKLTDELSAVLRRLEREFGDVQDVEFTVEDGKLWILQTRAAKRTPRAALRMAVDLVHEGLITPENALERLADVDLDALAETSLAGSADPVVSGIGASGGVAAGHAAFDTESAQRLAARGEPVILMRPDTSTADVAGFAVAAGIVTSVGARTAHAALIARQLAKPCVVGCGGLSIAPKADHASLGSAHIASGDWVTVDGHRGHVYLGRLDIVVTRPEAELAEVASWRGRNRQPQRSSA